MQKTIIIGLCILMILSIGCSNSNIESNNLDEFYEDMRELYTKGNVTFSVIYTELPQCSLGGTMMEINQNGTPKYWIEFVQK